MYLETRRQIILTKTIKNKMIALCLAMFMMFQISPVTVHAYNAYSNKSPQVVSERKDEYNNTIRTFDTGVEVTFYTNHTFLIKDYKNVLGSPKLEGPQPRSAWSTLGYAIFNAINVCSAIDYVSGVDVCRIALEYLGKAVKPDVKYKVQGRFVKPAPGCEPSHSYACQGHWEYKVS